MTPQEVALAFVNHFAAGDVDALGRLLAAGVVVEGPLFQGASRAAYLAALRADPPVPCPVRVRAVVVRGGEVAVAYDYCKPTGVLAIEQRFMIQEGCIVRMDLAFKV